ncbi:MAG: MFS transporter [Actinomycetota bacterium]
MPDSPEQERHPAPRAPRWREVFSGHFGRLTFGLFLLEALAAVQILVVTAVMPVITRELGGIRLYGWAFSASGLATVMAIPLTGQAVDRFGPRKPLALMLGVFGAGTLVAGLAPSMPVFVLGRFLQGAGAGAQYAVGLGTVAKHYPEDHRARVLALLAAAWVVPGLVGPSYGALLASTIGWRWALLSLVPLLAGASWLVFPGLAVLPSIKVARRVEVLHPILLSLGAAAIFAGLTDFSVWTAPLVLVGAGLAGPALRRLVVSGSALARPGLSAALAAGFLLSLAFFAVDGFVPLLLTRIRGQTVGVASLVVTLATVSWSLGTIWQSRVASRVRRSVLVMTGALAIAAGAAGVAAGLLDVPLAIPYVAWTIAGLGIGVAYPTIYLVTMERAGLGAEGSAVALMVLIDSLGVSVGTGLGGSAVALSTSAGAGISTGLTATFVLAIAAALALAAMSRRLDPARHGAS